MASVKKGEGEKLHDTLFNEKTTISDRVLRAEWYAVLRYINMHGAKNSLKMHLKVDTVLGG